MYKWSIPVFKPEYEIHRCPVCNGAGMNPEALLSAPCLRCNGVGTITLDKDGKDVK